ncbi:BolA family protein [endosymbiont of Ridgeia piscesae]|jgi:acid stress-induced BolA-like protein IbaG/YrbA|nr:BolA/IbaG family iron-sulfur metabolism protein [endosymbiont of Ridgeia piscesae]KRT56451.1 Acid stress-induced BolA-like protein IbaG/YrbA, predicted regulator of iron metabolism [endosymbiont of Ridgeia piscesae]KRT57853.1 Acid stress-induced BolA-like protein IbaG/YrbA, predicted regulator of iron metabolism [endosymbiont of Ridgeia piscesae]
METTRVEELIRAGLSGAEVTVTGDGRHFEAVVISAEFAGKSLIQKHRMVLATVQEQIANDELHALSIKKACTPEEWQAQQG